MADNILSKDRADADIALAAKDIGGVLFPRNVLVTPDGADLLPLTDAELRASPLPISGTVLVDNFPTPGLTDAQLRAAPVLVEESGPLLTLFIRLLNLLGAPVGYDKSQGRYRQTAIVESGTLTTVNVINTVNNQALIGGIQAQILPNGQNLSAWQACVRARIT